MMVGVGWQVGIRPHKHLHAGLTLPLELLDERN
jgi:hypothetical protein